MVDFPFNFTMGGFIQVCCSSMLTFQVVSGRSVQAVSSAGEPSRHPIKFCLSAWSVSCGYPSLSDSPSSLSLPSEVSSDSQLLSVIFASCLIHSSFLPVSSLKSFVSSSFVILFILTFLTVFSHIFLFISPS